jgi:hypothetical protein
MLGTVVGQGHGRLAGEERSVDADLRDTAGDTLWVLDADPVEAVSMTVGDLEVLPIRRNTGVEPECGASLAEAENRLQARAVEPARGSGVPGPSPPSYMRRAGVDVCGYGVRLALVAMKVRPAARVVDGAQKVEELDRPASVAEHGEGDDRPDRGVGVLSAVLPDAGDVSLDVSGVQRIGTPKGFLSALRMA